MALLAQGFDKLSPNGNSEAKGRLDRQGNEPSTAAVAQSL